MNRDDKDFTIVPGIGPEQDSRKDHDYRGRILRTTVTVKLPTLRERAYAFTDLPREKRLYFIDGLIAYGSYCNSKKKGSGGAPS